MAKETIGQRLRRARKKAGLTQAQLARMAGVTQVLISHLETGKAAETSQAHKLAAALGVSADWLLTGREASQPFSVTPRQFPEGMPLGEQIKIEILERVFEAVSAYSRPEYDRAFTVGHQALHCDLMVDGVALNFFLLNAASPWYLCRYHQLLVRSALLRASGCVKAVLLALIPAPAVRQQQPAILAQLQHEADACGVQLLVCDNPGPAAEKIVQSIKKSLTNKYVNGVGGTLTPGKNREKDTAD